MYLSCMASRFWCPMINIIVALIFLILFATILFQYTARYIYNYRVCNSGIKIVIFGMFPVISINYLDILEIRRITFKEALRLNQLSTLRLGNRMWGNIVLIKKSTGFFRTIIITPDNSETFMNDVNQQIKTGPTY